MHRPISSIIFPAFLATACAAHEAPVLGIPMETPTSQTQWLSSAREPHEQLLIPTTRLLAEIDKCLTKPTRISQLEETQEIYAGDQTFFYIHDLVSVKGITEESWNRCIVPSWNSTQEGAPPLELWDVGHPENTTLHIYSDALGEALNRIDHNKEEIITAVAAEVDKIPTPLGPGEEYQKPDGPLLASNWTTTRQVNLPEGLFTLRVATLAHGGWGSMDKSVPGVVVTRGHVPRPPETKFPLHSDSKKERLEIPLIATPWGNMGTSGYARGEFEDRTSVVARAISCSSPQPRVIVAVRIEEPLADFNFRYETNLDALRSQNPSNNALAWTSGLGDTIPPEKAHEWVFLIGQVPDKYKRSLDLSGTYPVNDDLDPWMEGTVPYEESHVRAFCN